MARDHAPREGEVRRVRGMDVHVIETAASGMPSRVRFVFPTALEDGRRTWLTWVGTEPLAFHPPRMGERVELPRLPFLSSMQDAKPERPVAEPPRAPAVSMAEP
jgi:hypothetical protein